MERQSTELSGGFAHLVWGVLSFAVLGLAVYQMLTGREWVSITMGGALAVFLAVWLLSELVRLPADRHYTRKLFARWSRRRLDTPMTVQADAESRSDLHTRGAIRALGSLNGEQVRRELQESGRVSRRTLRQVSRDENGPLADAPALFARQHELDPIPTLQADVNVEGFFAWARARIAAVVETKAQTVNGEITALLDDELRRINSVLTLADAAALTDVSDFTAWYNEPAGGYVERHNRAVDAYNQGIRHAVATVRLRSTTAAAAATFAGVAGLVYLTIHGNLTQNLLDAASQVGSASVSAMRDVVIWSAVAATALIGWKAWSGLSRWSMRCAHVSWNRRHPDCMLVLPAGTPGLPNAKTTRSTRRVGRTCTWCPCPRTPRAAPPAGPPRPRESPLAG